MDVTTQIRLLSGPVGPFVFRKLRDVVLGPWRRRKARGLLPVAEDKIVALKHDVRPLPSQEWRSVNKDAVTAFAAKMSSGDMSAYGVGAWVQETMTVDATDPRSALEFARMHQWPAYALAAAAGEDGLFDTFRAEVIRFSQCHPAMQGPLWRVAMDSGIRIHNMLVAWDWFAQAGFNDVELDKLVARSAAEHVIAIAGGLETAGGMATSHLLGDLLGLLSVATYTEDVNTAALIERTRAEIDKQILSDGMDFEASTGYHRQVAAVLAEVGVLSGFTTSINSSVTALAELDRAGMPLIGDNDDGMVLKLTGFDPDTSIIYDACRAPFNKENSFVEFPEFGLWIWHRDASVFTVRNGPVGQYGKGGHAHNDQNSITLSVDGRPVIVDPGCCCYLSDVERREYDRSTAAHATVDVGIEQAWSPHGSVEALFWLVQEGQKPRVHNTSVQQWSGQVFFGGSAKNHHTRSIELTDDKILLRDTVAIGAGIGEGARSIVIPLHQDARLQVFDTSAEITVGGRTCLIEWSDATAHVEERRYAPAYLKSVSGQALILNMERETVEWSISIL